MFQFTKSFEETKVPTHEWLKNNAPDFVYENIMETLRYAVWLETASKQLEHLATQQQQVIKELQNG
jgi:hypothetical protein